MIWLELGFGLALLVGGGEALVRGATALAARLGVSPLLIGLTVVGFGTSTPELVTSLQAAFAGSPGIAVGNVVGSNIANILLILGLAIVLMPLSVNRRSFLRDGTALMIATLACIAVVLTGDLTRPAGALLVLGLVAYVGFAYLSERTLPQDGAVAATPPLGLGRALLWSLGGIALTVLGARFLVDGATALALLWGVSESVIGLTIVAVGTSLPELVTSVVAAIRRQDDIAFGNVVGSNIYNVFGILGVTAIVRPIPVPTEIVSFDIWVMLGATLALIAVAVTGWRATRLEGVALMAAYALYIGWLAAGV